MYVPMCMLTSVYVLGCMCVYAQLMWGEGGLVPRECGGRGRVTCLCACCCACKHTLLLSTAGSISLVEVAASANEALS